MSNALSLLHRLVEIGHKSTWFCPIVLSRLAETCVADDA